MLSLGFFPAHPFHFLIVVYFFLGGLSAGAFLFSVYAKYLQNKLAPLADWGFWLPLPLLACGALLLIADLGHPERFYYIMLSIEPTSMAWWGTIFLNGFAGFNFLYVVSNQRYKILAYLGSIFALGVAAYTGLLLFQMVGRPLWHSPLTALVMFLGALLSGSAAVLLLGVFTNKIKEVRELLPGLGKLLAGIIALDLLLIVTEVLIMQGGDVYARSTALLLLQGSFSSYFLIGEIILGLVFPLILAWQGNSLKNDAWVLIFSLLLLFGGIMTRYVLVNAGQAVPILLPGGIL